VAIRSAQAQWTGGFDEGSGTFTTGSGAIEGGYTAGTRFGEDAGTNPEELIGAAHAACFSMALSVGLGRSGHAPESIETKADVHLDRGDAGWSITKIVLTSRARVPGIDEEEFRQIAEGTKDRCPVSKALASVPIELQASLVS
jgi:osmotically inducible protein OsmC